MDDDPKCMLFQSPHQHLHDWDVIVSDYLICEPGKVVEWKNRTALSLGRNYREEVIANYLKGVKHDDVVKRYSFLYLAPDENAS
jgi:hypothetical protein